MITVDKLVPIVKLKLPAETETFHIEDSWITLACNETLEKVRNYLLRNSVPDELLYTCSDIATDYVLAVYKTKQEGAGKAASITTVKKITAGRTTIENGETSSSSSSSTKFNPYKNIQDILNNYLNELNSFRLLWWE